MTKKTLKFLMELTFIFILPLLFILPCINIKDNYVYDNEGNFLNDNKTINFNIPFNYYDGDINVIVEPYYLSILSNYDVIGNKMYFTSYININDFDNKTIYREISYLVYIDFYDEDLSLLSTYVWQYDLSYDLSNIDFVYFRLYRSTENSFIDISTWNNFYHFNVSVINNNLTLIGQIRQLFIYSDLGINSNNIIFDIVLSYTLLWFIMFIIWHLFYLLLDFLLHFWRKEDK